MQDPFEENASFSIRRPYSPTIERLISSHLAGLAEILHEDGLNLELDASEGGQLFRKMVEISGIG